MTRPNAIINIVLKNLFTYLISHKVKASACITVFYSLFILPINESLAFILPLTNYRQLIFSSILKLLFSGIIFSLSYYSLVLVEQVIKHNKFYVNWLRYSSIYFVLSLPLFILIYPGYWVWDELYVLRNAQVYSMEAWQNIFTNLYHTFCLYLIPTGVGIIVIQIVIASLVIGYLLSKLRGFLHHPRLVLLAGIPFLFIPVLLNNLYPLRLTVYAYIEILVLFHLLLLLFYKQPVRRPFLYFFWMSSAMVLLSFWRTEGIFFLALLPILFFKLKLHRDFPRLAYQSYALILYVILLITGSWFATRYTADPKYQLTATISPLSILLQYDLKGDHIKDDLKAIDKVIDLKLLKDNPSYTDISALWIKGPRLDFQAHMSEFNKAYLDIIINNPGIFLETRTKTFLATNSLDSLLPPHIGAGIRFTVKDNPEFTYAFNLFYEKNRFSHIMNEKVKLATTRFVLFEDKNNSLIQPYAALVWTVIPTLLLLFIGSIVALWRKQLSWLFVSCLLLVQAGLIFLSAPANFFMYYFPIYLTGNFLLAVVVVSYIDRRLKKSNKDK